MAKKSLTSESLRWRGVTLSDLVSQIAANRWQGLSSAIRLFVLDHFVARAREGNQAQAR
jgi:predicted DNA-binding ribbon-helix-helix protein